MQARKKFRPRLFLNFNLVDAVDDNNFYKQIRQHLDLEFIYALTRKYYSHTGRPSLDPVVFFKIVLIGYLENLCSDRALERMIQNRLDLRLFIGYDIDESVPDHSTICKTRQRLPVEVFSAVFDEILGMCIKSGMVKGDIQSIDSAYINSNASLDKMQEVKMTDRDPSQYLSEVLKQDIDDPSEDEIALAKERAEKQQRNLEGFSEHRRLVSAKQSPNPIHPTWQTHSK